MGSRNSSPLLLQYRWWLSVGLSLLSFICSVRKNIISRVSPVVRATTIVPSERRDNPIAEWSIPASASLPLRAATSGACPTVAAGGHASTFTIALHSEFRRGCEGSADAVCSYGEFDCGGPPTSITMVLHGQTYSVALLAGFDRSTDYVQSPWTAPFRAWFISPSSISPPADPVTSFPTTTGGYAVRPSFLCTSAVGRP